MGVRRTGIHGAGLVSAFSGGGAFPACYRDKVLGYGPIAYWMLAEGAGAAAIDQVNSPAQDGTHVGVTLGQPGIGEPCGTTSPFYDGANDYTDIYSLTFNGVFDGAEGTALIWLKILNAGVWTDGIIRVLLSLTVDGANTIALFKDGANNTLVLRYWAGGVNRQITINPISSVNWLVLGLTWSATADELRGFLGGVQQGPPLGGLGVWAGPLHNNFTVVGAGSTVPANVTHGYLAHCAIWDSPLVPAIMGDLATF